MTGLPPEKLPVEILEAQLKVLQGEKVLLESREVLILSTQEYITLLENELAKRSKAN